tara:strand:+ start:406 stop:705 length:300 start_codon:yes stop_codon:yes gene_type:complete
MEFINDFLSFLKNNNILSTIIATVMSTYITQLTTSFADDIVMPIIYRDGDGDGKADIKSLENTVMKVNGIKIKIGKFLVVLLKVTIIFVTLYLCKKYMF